MPDYATSLIRRDPLTGAISYDFSGHIHAAGIDLDTTLVTGGADPDKKITWTRSDTGAVTAEVLAYSNVNGGTEDDAAILQAWDQAHVRRAQFIAQCSPQPSAAKAAADGISVLLVDGVGNSDFEFAHSIHEATATGATGALGGSFQTIPGLSITAFMQAGQIAVMEGFGTLNRTANLPSLFWVINPAGGGQTSLTASGGEMNVTGVISVPCFGTFQAPTSQNYTFSIQATCGGGGATAQNPGYARVTIS